MSTYTITNNTNFPMHVGTEWAHIVQEYRNFIKPGECVDIPAAGFGWQDVLVKHGLEENKISHDDDWKGVLSLGIYGLGGVATIAGAALSIAAVVPSGGTAAPIGAQLIGGVVAATAGLVSLVTDTVFTIADFTIRPAILTGMYGPDGYRLTITGGEIIGDLDPDTNTFKVTDVKPIQVAWENKVSGSSGTIGATR